MSTDDEGADTASRPSPGRLQAMTGGPDRCLARRAGRQLGVFTRQQALACGLRADTVYRRVRAGRYLQRYPGVFVDAAVPDSRDARRLAALLAVGGDAALAERTAADVHGLEHGLVPDRLHLVVRARSFDRRAREWLIDNETLADLGATNIEVRFLER